MTSLGNINQKEKQCQNSSLDFTRPEKCTNCILNLMKLIVILGTSLLTLNYSGTAETHNFARITLRFLFLWEKKNGISQVLSSSRACNHHQTVMKRNALSHRAAPLKEPVLLHPIPNARSESQFFFFLMTTPLSENSLNHTQLLAARISKVSPRKKQKLSPPTPRKNFFKSAKYRGRYPVVNQFRVTKPAQANIRQVLSTWLPGHTEALNRAREVDVKAQKGSFFTKGNSKPTDVGADEPGWRRG